MLDLEKLKTEIYKLSDDNIYEPNNYRITELIYCPAKSYLYRTEAKDRRPKINGKMLSGILFHEKLSRILPNVIQGEIQFEVECHRDYNDEIPYRISGKADAVNNDVVYEFKYTAANLYSKLPLHYCMQANAYAVMLNKPKFCIVYVNSMTLSVDSFESNADEKIFKLIEEQALTIHNSIKSGKCPKGPMYDWECKFCNLKDICVNYKGDFDEEVVL